MTSFLLIAVALFAGFLVVLALIAFAAFRISAKREGPAVGPAGGCALSAVLIGAGLFALIGFVVLAGLLFAGQGLRDGTFLKHRRLIEHDEPSWERSDSFEVTPPATDDPNGARQY